MDNQQASADAPALVPDEYSSARWQASVPAYAPSQDISGSGQGHPGWSSGWPVGKTNLPEFAAGSHTFNSLFGTTTNPYAPTYSAGGSSGGAAAAIAARIQPAGDGTDLGGSLRTPAAFCNIVGFRPSAGRIPLVPAANPYNWLSRQGLLAREVADVAFLMSCVAGPDPRSPVSLPEPDKLFGTRLRTDLAGVRVGWTVDFGLDAPVEPEILDVIRRQVTVFEELGATVEAACPDLSAADEVYATTRAFDFALSYGDLYRDHKDALKPSLASTIRHGLELTAAEMVSAAIARARLHHAAISVPAGFTPCGLPVGLQIVARDGADLDLLHAAHAFEQATLFARVPPFASRPH